MIYEFHLIITLPDDGMAEALSDAIADRILDTAKEFDECASIVYGPELTE